VAASHSKSSLNAGRIYKSEAAIMETNGAKLRVGFRGPRSLAYRRLYLRPGNARVRIRLLDIWPTLSPRSHEPIISQIARNDDEELKNEETFRQIFRRFQSLKPYMLDVAGRSIVEIPVTTCLWSKHRSHVSYLLYLRHFRSRGQHYWRGALAMCGISGVQPSLLLIRSIS